MLCMVSSDRWIVREAPQALRDIQNLERAATCGAPVFLDDLEKPAGVSVAGARATGLLTILRWDA